MRSEICSVHMEFVYCHQRIVFLAFAVWFCKYFQLRCDAIAVRALMPDIFLPTNDEVLYKCQMTTPFWFRTWSRVRQAAMRIHTPAEAYANSEQPPPPFHRSKNTHTHINFPQRTHLPYWVLDWRWIWPRQQFSLQTVGWTRDEYTAARWRTDLCILDRKKEHDTHPTR